MSEDDPRLVFVPIEKFIIPPPGLIEHLADRWWSVHPSKGLVFYDKKMMAPQCNVNESLVRRLAEKQYPWAETIFIKSVFRRINPRDYIC